MAGKQASGGKRMAATGRVQVQVWLDQAAAAAIDAARGLLHRTQFLALHGEAAAKKILKKSGKRG